MKKLLLLKIILFLFINAVADEPWKCLSVELNDTTLTYQADSMRHHGSVVFQWHDGVSKNDTIIMWMGCTNWDQLEDTTCYDCYDCLGWTFRVKIYESYAEWQERQNLVLGCLFDCAGPQPSITLDRDSSEFGNVQIGTTTMKMYYISGSNLPLSNIRITTPPGFQVSADLSNGGEWSNSMILADSTDSGYISDTIIYILFSPTSEEYYSGVIENNGCGAGYEYVTVSGTGYPSPFPECCDINYPEQNGSEIPVDVEFSWQVSDSVLGYKIVVDTVAAQLNELPLIDVGNNTEWTPTDPLQYNTTYYWRVTPYNDYADAEWCPIWEFVTESAQNSPVIKEQKLKMIK